MPVIAVFFRMMCRQIANFLNVKAGAICATGATVYSAVSSVIHFLYLSLEILKEEFWCRVKSMPSAGLDPAIPAIEPLQAYALD
jgi:hypothetical protein